MHEKKYFSQFFDLICKMYRIDKRTSQVWPSCDVKNVENSNIAAGRVPLYIWVFLPVLQSLAENSLSNTHA
jgi:hypothetical protein